MKQTWIDLGIDTRGRTYGEFKTTCPQCSHLRKHPKDPCLSVDMDNDRYNCHNCEFKGYLDTNPDSWKDRISRRADRKVYATPPPLQEPRTFADLPFQVAAFFRDRGISEATVLKMRITYEDGALKFPYFRGGELINVKYRRGGKRFNMESGAELLLYNLDSCIGADIVVICEGEMDALAVMECGIPEAMSVPNGAQAGDLPYLTSGEAIFEHARAVVLAVDNDEPGRALESDLARRIGKEKCFRVEWPEGCKDANDVLMRHGAAALRMCIDQALPYPVPGLIDPSEVRDDYMHSYDFDDDRGLTTGWPALDVSYTVVDGQLTIVSGTPGSGKSEVLDALMVNMAQMHDWRFAVFSPENYPIHLHLQKWAEKRIGKPFRGGYANRERMTRQEAAEAFEWASLHLSVMYPETPTLDELLRLAKIELFRKGVKGLVLDPWNEIAHDYGKLTETVYIGEALGKIRKFARDNDMHAWVLAHPRIMRKDRETGLTALTEPYDIAGSANFYNKADNILTVWRDKIDHTAPVKIHTQKIRFKWVGQLGTTELYYDPPSGRYRNGRWVAPGDS